MKTFPTIAILASTTLLTACGGSSTGSSDANFGGSGPITIPEINEFGRFVFDQGEAIEDGQIDALTQSQLKAEGSATYNGYMLGGIDETDDALIGRASVSVDFVDEQLSGSITDIQIFPGAFVEEIIEDDEEFVFEPVPADIERFDIAGSLALGGGRLLTGEENVGLIDIDVTGSVTIPAAASFTDNAESYDIDGALAAGVLSDDTFVASGDVSAFGTEGTFDVELEVIAR